MLILFDFKCQTCKYELEKVIDNTVHAIPCTECGGQMNRVISPVRCNLEGLSGHFPDAADKWARQHEKAGRMPIEE